MLMMTAFQDLPGPSRTFPEPCQLVKMISEPCSHLHQTRLIIGAPAVTSITSAPGPGAPLDPPGQKHIIYNFLFSSREVR